jgi:hypothetical protein
MNVVWPNRFLFLEISRPHLGTSFCLTELHSFMTFSFRKKKQDLKEITNCFPSSTHQYSQVLSSSHFLTGCDGMYACAVAC